MKNGRSYMVCLALAAVFAFFTRADAAGENGFGSGAMQYNKCPPGMALIPAGSFRMGCSPVDDQCSGDEQPPKTTLITKPFCMSAHETTQGEYFAATGKNPSFFSKCGADCPVERINWYEAKSFCEKTGRRLPTEAEWEYAARAGSLTKLYVMTDQRILSFCNAPGLADLAWYCGNSNYETHPVGQKKPNKFGLYDTLGNVWEWTQDCFSAKWYTYMPDADPVNVSPGCEYRVVRGGAWFSFAWSTRVSARYWVTPDVSLDMGVRCASDL